MVILYLTCVSDDEAIKIGDALLTEKLIVCVRRYPIQSSYWWDDKINHHAEVQLMMESVEDKFDQVDKVVSKLHSYDQYVLTMIDVAQTTPGVTKWLEDNLK